MTLQEAGEKLKKLNHLIGALVPKYNSPVKAISVAPKDADIIEYVSACMITDNPDYVAQQFENSDFDILILMSDPKTNTIVFGWHHELFPDEQ